jgi:hypothetical protein
MLWRRVERLTFALFVPSIPQARSHDDDSFYEADNGGVYDKIEEGYVRCRTGTRWQS